MNHNTVECVPNISEGRDENVINIIGEVIQSTPGVKLLHRDSSHAANRTVFTFTGDLDSIFEAAFSMYAMALEKIDMRTHHGTHPRTGAVDVCPFIALEGCDENELIERVAQFGKRLGDELGIIGFFYEKNANVNQRKNLANIRRGEYEGLADKLKSINWKPDFGKANGATLNQFGATTLGTRNFLIAYNINLDSKNAQTAQDIAEMVRELGKLMTLPDGSVSRLPGLLRSVKAIGWFVEDYDMAQVSFNLTDVESNGLYEVFEATKAACVRHRTKTNGSELIGMIPLKEILNCGNKYVKKLGLQSQNLSERDRINLAVKELGLESVRPFNPDERILEYRIEQLNTTATEES